MAKNNSAENIFLDLVVIPFDQIKNCIILDTYLPIIEHKDEIIKILKQELGKSSSFKIKLTNIQSTSYYKKDIRKKRKN